MTIRHTACIAADLDAVEHLEARFGGLDLVKTDLAPLVGASPEVMARDASAVREGRLVLFTSLREDPDRG